MRLSSCPPAIALLATVACADPDDPAIARSGEGLVLPDLWLPGETAPAVAIVSDAGGAFSPVHATLLPDGRVMFLGIPSAGGATKAALFTPTPLGQALPAAVTVEAQDVPLVAEAVPIGEWWVDDTPFCAGQTLLADGSLFVVGGTRIIASTTSPLVYMFGLDYAMTWDPAGWTQVVDRMDGIAEQGEPLRWYPTATRLSDGRVLVMGGRDYVAALWDGAFVDVGTENLTAEIWDPATETFDEISAYGEAPAELFNGDYSHVFGLPYGPEDYLVVFGEDGEPLIMLPDDPAIWVATGDHRPDTALDGAGVPLEQPNYGASTAMLPIRATNGEHGYVNGAILVAGGTHFRPHEHAIDVYDPLASVWHPRRDMVTRRHHPSTVLLPDGTVLVVAGHDDISDSTDPMVRTAQLVDPRDDFAIHAGTTRMGEVRGYHTISLLLPDGRVLVAGGRDAGPDDPSPEKPTLRYYYPPYFARPRPTLAWSPPTITYGAGFWTLHDRAVGEAVLVALGSMTHSIDMNQRSVQLPIVVGSETATYLAAPPDPQTAPPGYYMLFVLDAARTPSVARIVKVE